MGSKGTDDAVKAEHDENKHSTNQTHGPQTIGTSSLDALQSQDFRRMMDMVDKLRRSGLSGVVQLPQLVVCGDQSSGKSSVLEALTGIPFPRKENLCTRFATEIILRRAPQVAISTKIIPDKEATNLMGLGGGGEPARAFSRDVLSIEIAGPGCPHLTLVDLPGLIHSENKMQTKEDVDLIHGLVDDYLKEKRTIIMAVVSAKNDYANQIILKKCKDIDPEGHRTLGVITKPDFLEEGSENEASWVELAENKDIFFELGWHMLKNRSYKESDRSFEERNAAEKAFFSQGRYRDLSQDILGVDTLRTRLSHLLYTHLKRELPTLLDELNQEHSRVCRELEELGERRSTPQEQRRFLIGISTTYQDIVKAAVNGQYDHVLFGPPDLKAGFREGSNRLRLCAIVKHLTDEFNMAMHQYGHKLAIIEPDSEVATKEIELEAEYQKFANWPQQITRSQAIDRVYGMLVRSRGHEIPGTFNPFIVNDLFWDQAIKWQEIAECHLSNVAKFCHNLMNMAVDYAAPKDVGDRLKAGKVKNAFNDRLGAAKADLERIITDMCHHPITYDVSYTAIVRQMRLKKQEANLESFVRIAGVMNHNANVEHQITRYFEPGQIRSLVGPNMDKASAENALDHSQAYYKVIKRHFLDDLEKDTFSPKLVAEMADGELNLIAAEAEEVARTRANLEERKSTLEDGLETFGSALGLSK
ncbi:hypothetical protein KC343_g5239 [Hortaea werneckii]|nr:hypothetical protein KC323_g2074 [Hortaea werneckii]KAI6872630.1 hypothetical protein KC338_g2004 [Hortaea werneckii]KAI7219021.1 hypothetical protein KC352_g16437 [Hortaea werneckii]KAI7356822.1 hypothetical protein KC320_g2010 [Hortaea werneckii]KAI7566814.1 hypothetical protein KC317_g5416 [Hortaea werneckii]